MNNKTKIAVLILILIIIHNTNYIYYTIMRFLLYLRIKLLYGKHTYLYDNFNKIFKNVKNISSINYVKSDLVNIHKNSSNQYKIINMIHNYDNVTNIINGTNIENNVKKLLISCLPNVHIDGHHINLNDCVVVDLIYSDIQTFPSIHSDVEWGFFNNSHGFQVWYLYENNDSVGNMFLFDTPNVISSTYLLYENKTISTLDQCTKQLIKKINTNDNMDGTMYYLNMKKGECLIFGKNLYHMSDFRKSKYRYCLNFRVVIKDYDGGIPINTTDKCFYNTNMLFKIKKNNVKIINGKIYPNMFDLLHVF